MVKGVQQTFTKVIKRLEHLSHEEMLRDLGPLSLKKTHLRGNFTNIPKYLKGGHQENGARLSLVVPSTRTRRIGHKL